jgi:hypothetical protein
MRNVLRADAIDEAERRPGDDPSEPDNRSRWDVSAGPAVRQ